MSFGDFDNDGGLDLYVNGTVTGGIQYRDWLYHREENTTFVDVTPPELLQLNASHGATWVDFDLDGDGPVGFSDILIFADLFGQTV